MRIAMGSELKKSVDVDDDVRGRVGMENLE